MKPFARSVITRSTVYVSGAVILAAIVTVPSTSSYLYDSESVHVSISADAAEPTEPPTPSVPDICTPMVGGGGFTTWKGTDNIGFVEYLGPYTGKSIIFGLGGPDHIRGGNGPDCLVGGDGDDVLYGDNGPDKMDGGQGNDICYGGNGPQDYVNCELHAEEEGDTPVPVVTMVGADVNEDSPTATRLGDATGSLTTSSDDADVSIDADADADLEEKVSIVEPPELTPETTTPDPAEPGTIEVSPAAPPEQPDSPPVDSPMSME